MITRLGRWRLVEQELRHSPIVAVVMGRIYIIPITRRIFVHAVPVNDVIQQGED
jgi:hypothetical protein